MIVAFDSKEFRRDKVVDGIRKTVFYTPLGVGVEIPDIDSLNEDYVAACNTIKKAYSMEDSCSIYSSNFLIKKYGQVVATQFLESLIDRIQEHIESIFITYVILPPERNPVVKVGGVSSPKLELHPMHFLNRLNPMFSYITAWNYLRSPRAQVDELYIDSFSSKTTIAWESVQRHHPTIYPHGDECNLPISLADSVAYLTDKLIEKGRYKLKPDEIELAWSNYDIRIETRYLNSREIPAFGWYDEENVDWSDYQARPIMFLDLDSVNMKIMSELDIYHIATDYMSKLNGSIQGYDHTIDSKRIRDGDIFVYAGEEARKRALTFIDIWDIEILSLKDLRSKKDEK